MALLQTMMVAALIISGMGVALLGSVKIPLARRLAIDEGRVGGLVSVFGFALMPAILAAGFLTDHLGQGLGQEWVMIGGSVLLAAGLFVLALAKKYLPALVGVLIFSAGWSFMINVGNVLTPVTFPGSEARAANLLNVFFGMGAFLTPLAVGLLVRKSSLPSTLFALGGLALLPAFLTLGIDLSQFPARPPTGAGATHVLDNPYMWLLGLALFFYGPLEASMGAWTTTYLSDQGLKETTAAALLSAFWLTFMGARLATALALPPGQEAALIFVLSVLCIAVLSGVAFGRGPRMAMAMVILAGLIFGPIFPTLMGLLLAHFDPRVRGRAVGMLFAVGGIGWTLIPILIGTYARRTSVQRGFTIAVAAALGLTGVSAALWWW